MVNESEKQSKEKQMMFDEETTDYNRELAKSFISLFAKQISTELMEMRDSGVSVEDECAQNMIQLLHGLHLIAQEQTYGQIMKDKLKGDA